MGAETGVFMKLNFYLAVVSLPFVFPAKTQTAHALK